MAIIALHSEAEEGTSQSGVIPIAVQKYEYILGILLHVYSFYY